MWHEPANEGHVPLSAPRVMEYGTRQWTVIPGVLDPETFDLMSPESHSQFAYGDCNPFWDPSWGKGNDFSCTIPSESEHLAGVGTQLRFRVAGRRVDLTTLQGEPLGQMTHARGDRPEDSDIIRSAGHGSSAVVVTSMEQFDDTRTLVSLFSAPRIELVARPWFGDADYDWFMSGVVWPARAARWPLELEHFRSRLEGNGMRAYNNYHEAITRAHRLRDLHPDAVNDLIELSREGSALAKSNRSKLGYGPRRPDEQVKEYCYHRLVLALESQGRHQEALDVYDDGDACSLFRMPNVRKRIERKLRRAST